MTRRPQRASLAIVAIGTGVAIITLSWLVEDTGSAVTAREMRVVNMTAEATNTGAGFAPPSLQGAASPAAAMPAPRTPQFAHAYPAAEQRLSMRPPPVVAARPIPASVSQALRDPSPEVRLRAIRIIEAHDDERSAALLQQALSDPSVRIRRVAVAALSAALAPSRTAVVQQALGDTDPLVRRLAIDALDDSDGLRGLDVLYLALHDHDQDVRAAAVAALSDSTLPPATSLLELALADPSGNIRDAAREALSEK